MPVAHGYIRVSSGDQADSGLGLQALRDTVNNAYETRIKARGYEFGRIYEDQAVSGGKPLASRPEGRRLAGDLDRGDMVILPKLDRGFRNTEDALTTIRVWGERGIRVFFADWDIDVTTPAGRFFLAVGAAWAQLEREQAGERTRAALAVARKKGRHIGRLPFGLRAMGPKGSRRIEVIPEIYVVSKEILKWRLKDYTWEMIELHLRENNITRPVAKGSKLRKNWTIWACRAAYQSILRTLALIDQGKVHLPKGLAK